ncbi:dihydrolipoamide acetyltransferase component of pyruvate dehydrogenase complex [Sphaerisporangium melleum]|uniref:Dihydrolipoamide acetyltransferase component of pyruvate dehydrogenase complex n=1 Tax=Sphaerisporangium melleum TaxID=321316 RepID=A0A917VH61_9ACTN|nr:dihydrolipoamide acetyltransferase family protein [Sphaerisporangium melleum]GGK81092.1 dihydrolipoamide acetyltransferase component of pyruvate dehydrogenase complex [Sphaerisporangium melleum]GII71966.1 dihydrolipoamide acetyltransferase component of pyruvate dehydrogenase complex [Sphaerisporangium melleum]
MLREFKLPDVGEGLTEAEIVKWHVAAGDKVEINQTIVEIETAKAVVELPCPFEGVVSALMAAEGETVDVGNPIIAVEDGEGGSGAAGGAATGAPAVSGPGVPAAPAAGGPVPRSAALADDLVPTPPAGGGGTPARQPVLVGYGVKPGATARRPRKTTAPSSPAVPAQPSPVGPTAQVQARPSAASQAPTQAAPVARPAAPARVAVLAKPPVRKLARDLGVDLTTVTGTGPSGSITRDDVHAVAGAVAPAGAAVPAPAGYAVPAGAEREERIPVKGVRKATAAAMVASAFTAPHVTEWLQVDVTATMDAVRRLRELPDFAEVKVSPLLLVAKALLTAVRRYPMVNSSWTGEEIVVKRYVNLGIAAATPRGLIVPNVKEAQALSLPELARALGELTEKARTGRCTPADLTGGTITVTNVGVFGVDAGTPILNPGESAILAFGQVRDLPWVVDGQIVPRKVTTLALSFDHRVVDGELGSYVLRDVGAMLQDPLRMLAWS